MSAKLSVHHVGARAGSHPFPAPPRFRDDVTLCLYDADPSCTAQIAQENEGAAGEVHVLPLFLWDTDGADVTLHVTYDPYNSSAYELNPAYKPWHYTYAPTLYSAPNYDYTFEPCALTRETVVVRARTLDSLYARPGDDVPPPPDFLGIDVQGAAFEVLSGAHALLRSTILAVVTEVELHELYRGQHLFDDVFRLLRGHGFHFVDLTLFECSPFRAPVSFRARGFGVEGDALFLRDVERLPAEVGTDAWLRQASKLAFIALLFGRVEYAVMILGLLDKAGAADRLRDSEGLAYRDLLARFGSAVSRRGQPLRQTYADCYSYEASRAKFTPKSEPTRRDRLKTFLGRVPPVLGAARVAARAFRAARRRSPHIAWVALGQRRSTEAERLLRDYGLSDVAATMAAHRKAAYFAARR